MVVHHFAVSVVLCEMVVLHMNIFVQFLNYVSPTAIFISTLVKKMIVNYSGRSRQCSSDVFLLNIYFTSSTLYTN